MGRVRVCMGGIIMCITPPPLQRQRPPSPPPTHHRRADPLSRLPSPTLPPNHSDTNNALHHEEAAKGDPQQYLYIRVQHALQVAWGAGWGSTFFGAGVQGFCPKGGGGLWLNGPGGVLCW